MILLLTSTKIFSGAYQNGMYSQYNTEYPTIDNVMAHSNNDPCPKFQAIAYTLDTFLPIVDLQQKAYWRPKSNTECTNYLWIYLRFHIVSGWILIFMFTAFLAGVMQKE
jgi:hypothetical protein